MRHWYDEVRLGMHPIEEIGAAFYIREILGNDCRINMWDLKEVFGMGYKTHLENLRRSGILKVEREGSMARLQIIAPGDKKRKRSRRNANIMRWEKKNTHAKVAPETDLNSPVARSDNGKASVK